MGLREQKKEQTRHLIAETAWEMFADRGFDAVKVAEVAHAAGVSEATVFNYFPTKEDLFYGPFDVFETRLLDAIRDRDPGEPVLSAFRRYLLGSGGLLNQAGAGDTEALTRLRTISRVIADSPALRACELRALSRYTTSLAEVLAAEGRTPAGELGPLVVANALMGVHRSLLDHVRQRVSSGADPARLATEVRELGERAFALLEAGLGDYAPKPDG